MDIILPSEGSVGGSIPLGHTKFNQNKYLDKIKKMRKKQKHNERSAGGVVCRGEGRNLRWLVIKTRNMRSRRPVFKLPKGHLKEGELLKKAAIREVEEEGRVRAEILARIGSNNYIYMDKEQKKKIVKKVTFFLMRYLSTSLLRYRDTEEILAIIWLNTDEAIRRLDYKSEKIILGKAEKKLNNLIKPGKVRV